ncbi:MAG: UDP-N-acetylmuramate--L-alanine ligase [Chitinophagaceae bacterium]|nr:UDP-N-acetylmuramate--L-alanine ligase [Chitinophagaceae bacterium]
MNKLNTIQKIYFIGIGGIGMSALARFFHARGVQVSGYDKTATPLTKELEQTGIAIHYEENINLIPTDADVVVYTPAIPAAHAELVYYREHGFEVVKRSDVLQWITEASYNICVGGTHGKTTVTTMIGHLLRHSGYGCNAFLGGISANYHTNFWSSERNVVVVEADEYDRSFLKLVPDVAVVTAIDPDHLDIYGTPEAVEDAFIQFSGKVKPGGCLITKKGIHRENEFSATHHFSYSYNDIRSDIYVSSLTVQQGSYHFTVRSTQWILENVVLHMGGLHNVENAVAAIAVAKYLGIEDEKIKAAIADFKGVRRRFEYAVKNNNHVLIDDYAHHPEELKALISGVRSIYGEQQLTLVFQPHLFSRTQDLADGFARSLDMADEIILLPIYPARELPMPGVSSAMLAERMENKKVALLEKQEMVDRIRNTKPGLVVMAGAGDIDALVGLVKQGLES